MQKLQFIRLMAPSHEASRKAFVIVVVISLWNWRYCDGQQIPSNVGILIANIFFYFKVFFTHCPQRWNCGYSNGHFLLLLLLLHTTNFGGGVGWTVGQLTQKWYCRMTDTIKGFYPRALREDRGSSDGHFLLLLLFFFHTSRALFLLGTERFC